MPGAGAAIAGPRTMRGVHDHQRRPRTGLPRDRRHPRGQGRDPVQDRRLPPRCGRHRQGAVRRRVRLRAGDRRPIPGVGQAIGDKIVEMAATGHIALHDRLRARSRRASWTCSGSRVSGPRPCAWSGRSLGIDSMEDLRRAAEAGRLRGLKGISGRHGAADPRGHHAPRLPPAAPPAGPAQAISDALVAQWSTRPGSRRIVQAGSLRRRRETVGDLDLLVETDAPEAVDRAVRPPSGRRRGHRRGEGEGGVRLAGGPQVDLMVMPPGEAGTYLVHFTGSAAHNVRLRGIARDRGWSLSEKGFLRLGDDGEPRDGRRRRAADLRGRGRRYGFLGLPFIEPELREDEGEVEAGVRGAAAVAGHAARTCGATCTATPTGATASTRSRSWPRPPAGADTPTRC